MARYDRYPFPSLSAFHLYYCRGAFSLTHRRIRAAVQEVSGQWEPRSAVVDVRDVGLYVVRLPNAP